MQISLNQLQVHLNKQMASIYLIHGDEFLLRQEARDLIRLAAKQNGFSQYQYFDVENKFSWNELNGHYYSASIFQERSFLQINYFTGKFDQNASQVLINFCQKPIRDKILLILCNKLTAAQLKASWYQAIQQQGVTIQIYPVNSNELPRWISERLQKVNLKADHDAIKLLAELTEGNLLACQQAIEKLKLLYPNSLIKSVQIYDVVNQSGRYNVFALMDYALKGESRRVLTILKSLQAEGVEATLVLWALARELRQLYTMLLQLQSGHSIKHVISSQWQQRQNFYQAALQRLQLSQITQLLKFANHIDRSIKGLSISNSWQELATLSLAIASGKIITNFYE